MAKHGIAEMKLPTTLELPIIGAHGDLPPMIHLGRNVSRLPGGEFSNQNELVTSLNFYYTQKYSAAHSGIVELTLDDSTKPPKTGQEAYEPVMTLLQGIIKSEIKIGNPEAPEVRWSKEAILQRFDEIRDMTFDDKDHPAPKFTVSSGHRRTIPLFLIWAMTGTCETAQVPFMLVHHDTELDRQHNNLLENSVNLMSKKADKGGYMLAAANYITLKKGGPNEKEVAKFLGIFDVNKRGLLQSVYAGARFLYNHPNLREDFLANDMDKKIQNKHATAVKMAKTIDDLKAIVNDNRTPPVHAGKIKDLVASNQGGWNSYARALLDSVVGGREMELAELASLKINEIESAMAKRDKSVADTPKPEPVKENQSKAEPIKK